MNAATKWFLAIAAVVVIGAAVVSQTNLLKGTLDIGGLEEELSYLYEQQEAVLQEYDAFMQESLTRLETEGGEDVDFESAYASIQAEADHIFAQQFEDIALQIEEITRMMEESFQPFEEEIPVSGNTQPEWHKSAGYEGPIGEHECRELKMLLDDGSLSARLNNDMSAPAKCAQRFPHIWGGGTSLPSVTFARCDQIASWIITGSLSSNVGNDFSEYEACVKQHSAMMADAWNRYFATPAATAGPTSSPIVTPSAAPSATAGPTSSPIVTPSAAPSATAGPTVSSQHGSLSVSHAGSAAFSDRLVVLGESNVPASKFVFRAQGEDFKVRRLSISNLNTSSIDSIKKLTIKYPKNFKKPTDLNGTSFLFFPQGGGNTVTFDGIDIAVPKHTDVAVEVYVDTADTIEGGDSDDVINLYIKGSTVSSQFTATGLSSGTDVHTVQAASARTFLYLRKTVPTISYTSRSTALQYNRSGAEALRFKVTADSASTLDVRKFTFEVSTNGLDMSVLHGRDWNLYEASDLNTSLSSNKLDRMYGTVAFVLPTPYEVSTVGREFVVMAPIAEDTSQATTAVLSIRFSPDSNALASNTERLIENNGGRFIWSDRSASSHSLRTSDWYNGFLVDMPSTYFVKK